MMDILKRLEALEQHIVARDSSKLLDFDALLPNGANKPTQEEQSKPVKSIDFEEMIKNLSDYRKSQSEKKDENEIPQQIIIE